METLDFASIADLSRQLRARQLSPVELVDHCIARIERYDGQLNAFLTPTLSKARADAKRAEAEIAGGTYRGPMHGIPYALKDIYETAGVRTTGHSRLFADFVPVEDAHSVARLNASGAILLGKLATHEFAHGGPSFDLAWPPARNPWDPNHETGGSSSGSGAAVAAGLVPLAMGSDTGGSIRSPAGLCGLVGLKPTYGRVSRHGIFANSYSYDHAGPLTRTVEDAAIALDALSGFDARDPASARVDAPKAQAALDGNTGGLNGLRIGFIRHFFEDDMAVGDDVRSAIETASEVFAHVGATIEPVRLRPLPVYQDIKVTQAEAEVFAIHRTDLQTRIDLYGRDFLGRVLPACLLNGADYLAASRERARVVEEMKPIYERFDLLLTIGPGPAPAFGRWRTLNFWEKGSITAPFNVTGAPALVQCMGYNHQGLPLSLQLVGRPFDEATLLRAAHAYEHATQWLARTPVLDELSLRPLPSEPDPAASSLSGAERAQVEACVAHAELTLSEPLFEQLCATAPLVRARVDRVGRGQSMYDGPSNVFRA
ncbi:MAG: amidase [Pseudomonadota bacterium]